MGLAPVEVQRRFLVTFESFLNHFSDSPWSIPGLILHTVKSAGTGGGDMIVDREVSIEISEPAAAIFACEYSLGRAWKRERPPMLFQ